MVSEVGIKTIRQLHCLGPFSLSSGPSVDYVLIYGVGPNSVNVASYLSCSSAVLTFVVGKD